MEINLQLHRKSLVKKEDFSKNLAIRLDLKEDKYEHSFIFNFKEIVEIRNRINECIEKANKSGFIID